jgi:hypothetical protein
MPTLDSSEKERALQEVTEELKRLHDNAQSGLGRMLRQIAVGALSVLALFTLCSGLSGLRVDGAHEELGPGVPVVIFILGSALIFGWHLVRPKK